MPRGRNSATQKATGQPASSEPLGKLAIDAPTKRAHTSNDDSPRASSPPKRQMTAAPGSHSLGQDATVAALQSALFALKEEVAGLKSNLTEHDTRLRAVEAQPSTDDHQPTPAAIVETVQVQQPEPNIQEEPSRLDKSDVAATSGKAAFRPLTDSEAAAFWAARNTFKKISSSDEEHRRWNEHLLWSFSSIHHWGDVLFPGLERAVTAFCMAAFANTHPLKRIDVDTAAWVASWAPNFREQLESNRPDERAAFFHACLWHLLNEELFSNQAAGKWKDGPWTTLGHLLSEIQPNMKHADTQVTFSLFTAKRHLVRHHYTFHGYHSDPKRLEDIIRRRLGSMITTSDQKRSLFARVLSTLATAAIKADFQILSSLWDIHIEMADPETAKTDGFVFDNTSPYMDAVKVFSEDRTEEHGPEAYRRVAFVSEPLVRVWGDEAGQFGDNQVVDLLSGFYVNHYHSHSVKRKMKAVLGPYEEPPEEEVPTEVTEDAQHTIEDTEHSVKDEDKEESDE